MMSSDSPRQQGGGKLTTGEFLRRQCETHTVVVDGPLWKITTFNVFGGFLVEIIKERLELRLDIPPSWYSLWYNDTPLNDSLPLLTYELPKKVFLSIRPNRESSGLDGIAHLTVWKCVVQVNVATTSENFIRFDPNQLLERPLNARGVLKLIEGLSRKHTERNFRVFLHRTRQFLDCTDSCSNTKHVIVFHYERKGVTRSVEVTSILTALLDLVVGLLALADLREMSKIVRLCAQEGKPVTELGQIESSLSPVCQEKIFQCLEERGEKNFSEEKHDGSHILQILAKIIFLTGTTQDAETCFSFLRSVKGKFLEAIENSDGFVSYSYKKSSKSNGGTHKRSHLIPVRTVWAFVAEMKSACDLSPCGFFYETRSRQVPGSEKPQAVWVLSPSASQASGVKLYSSCAQLATTLSKRKIEKLKIFYLYESQCEVHTTFSSDWNALMLQQLVSDLKDPSLPPKVIECWTCGEKDPRKKCGGCEQAFYCNKTCQKKHWKFHKKACKLIQ